MANPAAAAPAGPQACEISHSAGGDSSKCSSSTCSSKPWGGAPEKWRRHGPMPLPTRAALAALSAALVGALLLHALALFLPPVGAEADALLPVRMQLQGAVLSGTSGAGAEQAPTNVSLVASPPPLRQQPPAVNERVQEARRQLLHMQQHVARQGPAASFWPTGCRWRLAAPTADDVAASGLCDPARVPERGRMFGGGFPDVWRCSAHTWSSSGEQWAAEQPAACRLDAVPLPAWAADRAAIGGSASLSWGTAARLPTWALEEWWARQAAAPQSAAGRQQHGGSSSSVDSGASGRAAASLPEVSTDVRCATGYCVFRGLWYSGGRFYILADPSSPQASLSKEWQLTRNRQGGVLHVASAAAFAASVRERARVVPGGGWVGCCAGGHACNQRAWHLKPASRMHACLRTCVHPAAETTVVDSPFWMHGGAIGHTLEALLPLFSTLRHEPLVRRTPDRLLLLFQQRASLGDWARGLLAAALGVLPGQDLPPLVFQQQVANPLQQPESLLEGVGPDEWLMFEQVRGGGVEGAVRRSAMQRTSEPAPVALPACGPMPAGLPPCSAPAHTRCCGRGTCFLVGPAPPGTSWTPAC